MVFLQKRRAPALCRSLEFWVDLLGLLIISGYFLSFLRVSFFTSGPATGGDTGSHYWALVTLVEHALPAGQMRVWNPGNLGGEPHLVYYFPLPFLLMALFSIVMALPAAFNAGTLLPILMFPISAYLCMRLLGRRFPTPLLAAAAVLFFIFNESFDIWGGNAIATLKGQFAHAYALNFFLLALGAASWELRRDRFPWLSAPLFAAVCLSHAYVMLGLPFVFVALLIFTRHPRVALRLKKLAVTGILSLGLAAWFVVPLLESTEWTTPYSYDWDSGQVLSELAPVLFWPLAVLAAVACVFLIFRRRRGWLAPLALFLLPAIGYGAYYFIFPALQLEDMRALPQIQLFFCMLCAVLIGTALRCLRTMAVVAALPLVCFAVFWVNHQVKVFPHWLRWDYSGWYTKAPYGDLERLYSQLRGNFSQPRVVAEYDNVTNMKAGTERLFEMLPFFAGRATLEGQYIRSSVLSPAIYYLWNYINYSQICPFLQYTCAEFDFVKAEDSLRLFGVGELILQSAQSLRAADEMEYLKAGKAFGIWHLYSLKPPPSLVETFQQQPVSGVLPAMTWKETYFKWLTHYTRDLQKIVLDSSGRPFTHSFLRKHKMRRRTWRAPRSCRPSVEVNFDTIRLKTPCPGYAHFLKFGFHDTWRADTGDELFLVSPGFIGIVPSKSEVVLTFGNSRVWYAAGVVSIISFVLLVVGGIVYRQKRKR